MNLNRFGGRISCHVLEANDFLSLRLEFFIRRPKYEKEIFTNKNLCVVYLRFDNMTCRIGMSSNPGGRINHWRNQCENRDGKFSSNKLASGLTYDEAQALERRKARECGNHCQQESGGERKPGRVYTVYRVDCD